MRSLLLATALVAATAAVPAQAQSSLERPPIQFTLSEVNNGRTLVAVPQGEWWVRAAYPDLRNELRRQWHAANPRRVLLNCTYQRPVVGEISCDIVPR